MFKWIKRWAKALWKRKEKVETIPTGETISVKPKPKPEIEGMEITWKILWDLIPRYDVIFDFNFSTKRRFLKTASTIYTKKYGINFENHLGMLYAVGVIKYNKDRKGTYFSEGIKLKKMSNRYQIIDDQYPLKEIVDTWISSQSEKGGTVFGPVARNEEE